MTRSNSVILFLWFGYLSATTAMGYSVVKTESYVCDSPNAVIRGSGLIFKDEGKYFVLSSAHVFLSDAGSGEKKFCHRVGSPESSKWSTASIKLVDWGFGLALVEVQRPDVFVGVLKMPSLNDLPWYIAEKEAKGIEFSIAGYPAHEDALVRVGGGILSLIHI